MAYPEDLWTYPEPKVSNVVNLNDQGLSEGDTIDPYLDQYLSNATRVEIEPGNYDFNGSGLNVTLERGDLVGLGDRGDVVLHGGGHNCAFRAKGTGTTRLKNITIKGNAGGYLRCEAVDPSAELVYEHVSLPDGTANGSDDGGLLAAGTYSNIFHRGTLRLLWCHVEGFADNGAYVDGPAHNGEGRVVVVGGLYKSNNIADIRIGTDDSNVYRPVINADGNHPTHANGANNARGLRVRQNGKNILVDDVDLYYNAPGNGPVCYEIDGTGSTGTFRDFRLQNETSSRAIKTDNDSQVDSNWTFEDVHISGGGSHAHGVTLEGDSVTGSGADSPDLTPWWGDEESDPLEFRVSDLDPTSVEVSQGELFDMEAVVRNMTDSEVTQRIEARIGDTLRDSTDLTLAGDDGDLVEFTGIETDDIDPGTYDFGIYSEDSGSTGTITIEEAPGGEPIIPVSISASGSGAFSSTSADLGINNRKQLRAFGRGRGAGAVTDVNVTGPELWHFRMHDETVTLDGLSPAETPTWLPDETVTLTFTFDKHGPVGGDYVRRYEQVRRFQALALDDAVDRGLDSNRRPWYRERIHDAAPVESLLVNLHAGAALDDESVGVWGLVVGFDDQSHGFTNFRQVEVELYVLVKEDEMAARSQVTDAFEAPIL